MAMKVMKTTRNDQVKEKEDWSFGVAGCEMYIWNYENAPEIF